MADILVPIFVCVVLPVAIVLIVFLAAMNSDNKRAEVLIKAIEASGGADADKLAEALRKPRKTAREILNGRLLRGCIFSLIGLVLIVLGIVSVCSVQLTDESPDTGFFVIGGISLAIGASFLIVYAVTRKQTLTSGEK